MATAQPAEPQERRPGVEHREVVREAGLGRVSILSIVAGTLASYGAFALIAAGAAAVLSAIDVDTDFTTNNWRTEEAAAAILTAVVLFLSYLFGGYVAGRMARRSGLLHGAAVFVLGLLAAIAVGGLVSVVADESKDDDLGDTLRSIGAPTTLDEWGDVAAITAVAAVALMAVGAILGGLLGERWHTKLARRALDPEYGPEADARRREADERAAQEKADRERSEREQEEREQVLRDRAQREQATRDERHAVATVDADRNDEPVADRGASGFAEDSTLASGGSDDREQRLSASEWARATNRGDEPRLSPAEWAEIDRTQAARRDQR